MTNNDEVLEKTRMHHVAEPSCCGCWHIVASAHNYLLRCNECGAERSIVPLMEISDASNDQTITRLFTEIERLTESRRIIYEKYCDLLVQLGGTDA